MMGTSLFKRSRNRFLFAALLTSFALLMLAAAGQRIGLGTIVFLFAYNLSCEALGQHVLKFSRLDGITARASAAYLVGFFLTGALLYALVLWAGVSAQTSMAIMFLACFALFAVVGRRSVDGADTICADEIKSLLPLILVAAAALLKYAAIPLQIISGGRLNLWNDYFLHGVTLETIGGRFAYGGSFELVGIGINKYYHYLPFMFSSVVMSVQGMNGLSAATSVLLPQSVLVCLLGIYVLCAQLSNLKTGLLVAILSTIVPGYLLFFQSGWFDPYWGVFIQPGAGYGLALCLLITAAVQLYCKAPDWRRLGLMSALTLLVGVTRFHFFLLMAPLLMWIFVSVRSQSNPYLWLKGLLGLGIASIVLPSVLLWSNRELLSYAKTAEYLDFNVGQLLFYGERLFQGPAQGGLSVLLLILAMVLAVIGAYALIYAGILASKSKSKTLEFIDLLPLALLLVYVLLMIFAPVARNGDLTEYKHRHFPFVYIVFAVFCNTHVLRQLEKFSKWQTSGRSFGAAVAVLLMLVLPITWLTEAGKPDFKSMQWARNFHGNVQEKEKFALAEFIQKNSLEGDVLLVGNQQDSAQQLINSLTTELISLADVPASLSRPDLFRLLPGCPATVTSKRLHIPTAVANSADWNAAARILKENHIRWFIYDQNARPAWAHAATPAYANERFAVFDAGHVASKYEVLKNCAQ